MDDPSTDRGTALVSHLRDAAAARLGNAARSRDPQESDQLTREALSLLDQARAAANYRAERSAWPDHASFPR